MSYTGTSLEARRATSAKTRISRSAFFALAATVLVALPTLGGCGGSSDGLTTSDTLRGLGTLLVAMSDAPPASTISAVNITIDRVEAGVNDSWTEITAVPKSYNLLDLVRNEATLGSAQLPAGRYTQVRFFPSSATVTDATGTHPLTIPGGAQTGIKVNVNYDINPNQITTVLLDFNVGKSVIRQGNGNYRLQPVIPAVVKVLSGTVTGAVVDADGPLVGATVTATYTAGDKYPIGSEVNTSTTLGDGTFKVWALLPGTYTITATYIDPTNSATKTVTRTDVVVNADQNADLGVLVAQ